MPAVDPWQLIGAILPHVRDPWPQSIGLGFPFTLAGALSMLADALVAEVPRRRHDRVVRRFGVFGFRIGVGLYLLSLLVQLIFSL